MWEPALLRTGSWLSLAVLVQPFHILVQGRSKLGVKLTFMGSQQKHIHQ